MLALGVNILVMFSRLKRFLPSTSMLSFVEEFRSGFLFFGVVLSLCRTFLGCWLNSNVVDVEISWWDLVDVITAAHWNEPHVSKFVRDKNNTKY